jgi:hypothetical protein
MNSCLSGVLLPFSLPFIHAHAREYTHSLRHPPLPPHTVICGLHDFGGVLYVPQRVPSALSLPCVLAAPHSRSLRRTRLMACSPCAVATFKTPSSMERFLFAGTTASSSMRRCVWRRTAYAHSSDVASLQVAHRVVTSSVSSATTTMSSTDPVADCFSPRLLAAPHRDATHVPYGDWFALYVGLRKAWKTAADAVSSGASSQGGEQSLQTKVAIDALLWNSLFARHWTEVQVQSTTTSTPFSTSRYRWWWHPETSLSSLPPPPHDATALSPVAVEVCTSDFLAEPLLGGRYLQLWMEDVRAAAASPRTADDDASTSADGGAPTVLFPFSALWEIKRSAYWRPFSTQTAAAAPAFSLQERQARQALLQTIDQLLQLQCDASKGGSPHQRIRVLSPTQEWDLMCLAPRFRQVMYPSIPTTASTTPPAPPRWLSIEALCEDAAARLAYCAHTLSWQQRQALQQAVTPVRVLSPSSEHARLRSYALTSVHEHSSAKEALNRRHAARQQSTASAATVHGQARKGCSDAVRRMSSREENIRQSFSVR